MNKSWTYTLRIEWLKQQKTQPNHSWQRRSPTVVQLFLDNRLQLPPTACQPQYNCHSAAGGPNCQLLQLVSIRHQCSWRWLFAPRRKPFSIPLASGLGARRQPNEEPLCQ
jgi:hypothetical protein